MHNTVLTEMWRLRLSFLSVFGNNVVFQLVEHIFWVGFFIGNAHEILQTKLRCFTQFSNSSSSDIAHGDERTIVCCDEFTLTFNKLFVIKRGIHPVVIEDHTEAHLYLVEILIEQVVCCFLITSSLSLHCLCKNCTVYRVRHGNVRVGLNTIDRLEQRLLRLTIQHLSTSLVHNRESETITLNVEPNCVTHLSLLLFNNRARFDDVLNCSCTKAER